MSFSASLRLSSLALSRTRLRPFDIYPASANPHHIGLKAPLLGLRSRVDVSRAFSSSSHRSLRPSSRARSKYVRFDDKDGSPGNSSSLLLSDSRVLLAAGLTGAGLFYYIYHLERVPETGRWRFMDVNPKNETQISREMYVQLLRENEGKVLPPNHPVTLFVREIVQRILHANDLGELKDGKAPVVSPTPWTDATDSMSDWVYDAELNQTRGKDLAPGTGGREWNLLVIDAPKVPNAAAVYGNIAVYTGILSVCKDADQLAAVLGHEMGHVVARHASERYSFSKYVMALAGLLSLLLSFDFGLGRSAMSLLLELPMSRQQELEADKIGLRLTSKACYQPEGAIGMFENLLHLEKLTGSRFDFLQTHPATTKRITALKELMTDAYAIQAATPECAQLQGFLADFGHAPGNTWARSHTVPLR